MSTSAMAQDINTQIAAISKVVKASKGNPDAAKDQVKDFFKANKKNAVALAGLGRAYLDIKDFENATKYAEMAIKVGKEEADGYILMGDIAAVQDNGGDAAMWYETATRQAPKDPEGYIKYARVYQKVDAAGAEEKLRALTSIDPAYPVDAEIAHMYFANNKYGKAFENYQKVDKNKITDDKLVEYATSALVIGKSNESLEAALFGVNKYPRNAALNRITFYNYTDLMQYDNALKYADALFNKCDSAKFTSRDYLYAGHAYKGAGNTAEAIKNLNKVYEMDNTQTDVLKIISETYLQAKDYDKAVEFYNKFVDANGSKKTSDYTYMAKIYLDMAETVEDKKAAYLKADQVYADMAEQFPNNEAFATYQRAHIHHAINPDLKTGEAKPFYEKYASMVEQDAEKSEADIKTLAEAYNYLAVHYIHNDNVATAKEYANKLIAIQPDNETAKQIIAIK